MYTRITLLQYFSFLKLQKTKTVRIVRQPTPLNAVLFTKWDNIFIHKLMYINNLKFYAWYSVWVPHLCRKVNEPILNTSIDFHLTNKR
jgi:hypothetical protein